MIGPSTVLDSSSLNPHALPNSGTTNLLSAAFHYKHFPKSSENLTTFLASTRISHICGRINEEYADAIILHSRDRADAPLHYHDSAALVMFIVTCRDSLAQKSSNGRAGGLDR
jgi:hypothetical protein